MVLELLVCCIIGILMGSLGSWLLAIYENIEIIDWKTITENPLCAKCKKKLKRKRFLPVIGYFFRNNDCLRCKRRVYIMKPILEILTAILFVLIRFFYGESNILIVIFRMLTSWILLLIAICDIIRYEIHIPLIILGYFLVLLSMILGVFGWSNLRGSLVFFMIFSVLYYGSLWYTKVKYKTEEEGIGMGDLIISPYLGVLLYMGISAETMYIEELFCSVLIFFILTSIFGIVVYVIQNVIFGKKADFLSDEMAEKSLPLVPSMVLSLLVVIVCHKIIFNTLINFGDKFFEYLMN